MSRKKSNLDPILRALVGMPVEHQGLVRDVVNRLSGKDVRAVKAALTRALHEAVKVSVSDTTHLRFVEAVELVETNRFSTFVKANDKFPGYFDQDFVRWGTDVAGPATGPATALVYEMTKDGSFETLFSSIGPDWQKHMPTQAQALAFCEYHPDSLHPDGNGTFFPFRVEGTDKVFVANVYLGGGQRRVYCYRLSIDGVWYADCRHRVVVLQNGALEA